MTLLADVGIRRHMDWGSVVIDPFRPERLNTDSYDLELGPWFWRYTRELNRHPEAMGYGQGFELVDARGPAGLWLASGERVLGHSVEIAGGTVGAKPNTLHGSALSRLNELAGAGPEPETVPVAVTTHLQATSTAGRHGISACMCAGYGDVGFVNIWTLEITNHSPDRLWLPVGAIIAQVAFTRVEVPSAMYGAKTGNYVLDTLDPVEIRRRWHPRHMLPKALKTRDTWREFFPHQPQEAPHGRE